MKESLINTVNKNEIPSIDLVHGNVKVDFAMRTMEYIYDKSGGITDLPHRHEYYTLVWVKEGTGKHIIDYRLHEITNNLLFFVSPGQVHQVITTSRPIGLVILFTPDFLAKHNISTTLISNLGLFSDFPDTPPIEVTINGQQSLEYLAQNLLKTFESNDLYKNDTLGAWLKLFLIECNKFSSTNKDINSHVLQSGSKILIDFKHLVEKNYTLWHMVSDYASELAISPDYLNNVIKNSIGKTAKEYIQNRLVIEAKRYAVVTTLNSKEIAFKLGFDDPAHFSKFFKNYSGIAFSEFRDTLILK